MKPAQIPVAAPRKSGSRIKPFLKSALSHVREWGENYIQIPVIVGLLLGSIWFFKYLTQRSPVENPGAIVGWLINALGVCIVASLTGLSQRFLYGFTSKLKSPPDFSHLILDSCVTSYLLLLWSVLIFGLLR